MTESANSDDLIRRMMAMSDGDISVLVAALKQPNSNSVMVTPEGSPNDALWSKLAALGWMSRNPDLSLDETFSVKMFSITAAGIEPIRTLLATVQMAKAKALRNN